MTFIQLTLPNGNPLWVNLGSVCSMGQDGKHTRLCELGTAEYWFVSETPEQILQKIREARSGYWDDDAVELGRTLERQEFMEMLFSAGLVPGRTRERVVAFIRAQIERSKKTFDRARQKCDSGA